MAKRTAEKQLTDRDNGDEEVNIVISLISARFAAALTALRSGYAGGVPHRAHRRAAR